MADWHKITSFGNVEDRRGLSGAGALAGGGGLLVILATLGLNLLGVNISPNEIANMADQLGINQVITTEQPPEFKGQDSYETFAGKVLGSSDDVWADSFSQNGLTYNPPKLVLYRNATMTGCGLGASAVGPFYCPPDSTIYLDETFFDELKRRFGGSTGEVAQAYVIAHEVGRHVQNQLGVFGQSGANTQQGSIQTELQADCYAGIWAYSLGQDGIFKAGEIQQATDAAAAVGDDNIQQKTEGRVTPENWTHGSSQQRVNAFNVGYQSGQPSLCKDLN